MVILEAIGPVSGCPAHAGIDLHVAVGPWEQRRLPRPRGDRPLEGSQGSNAARVAPPTRG